MSREGLTKNVLQLRAIFPKFDRYTRFKRFLTHVKIRAIDSCWLWEGSTDKDGYGWYYWRSKNINFAHIAAYELFIGRRHGLKVCHSCDTPGCVNPTHLWLGTNKQNSEDMVKKARKGKLTLEAVTKVRKLYGEGKLNQQELADKFGVTNSAISRIVTNDAWRIQ